MSGTLVMNTAVGAEPRRWRILILLLVGIFLAPLDFFIVNVGLPAIQQDLQASPAELQLVITAFGASYAIFLIMGGRLGDIYGRARLFVLGQIAFTLASIICGVAPSISVLIIGRVLQGLFAAAMVPQGLAVINTIFPADEKPRALSLYAATYGFAAAAGQMIGGYLISADVLNLGWRAIFLLNVPIGIGVAFCGSFFLPKTPLAKSQRIDWVGVVLLAFTLAFLIVPLIEGRQLGWPWWSVVGLAIGFPLFTFLFLKHERSFSKTGSPLVEPEIWKSPALRLGLGAAVCFYSIAVLFLLLAIYFQTALREDALTSGVHFAPFGLGFFLGPLVSPALMRVLKQWTVVVALSVEVVLLILIADTVGGLLDVAKLPLSLLLAITGLCQGAAMPALFRVIFSHTPSRHSGLIAGTINSALQISAALSVAVIGGFFFSILGLNSDLGSISRSFSLSVIGISIFLSISVLLLAILNSKYRVPQNA